MTGRSQPPRDQNGVKITIPRQYLPHTSLAAALLALAGVGGMSIEPSARPDAYTATMADAEKQAREAAEAALRKRIEIVEKGLDSMIEKCTEHLAESERWKARIEANDEDIGRCMRELDAQRRLRWGASNDDLQ